jgi:hypothetical protein
MFGETESKYLAGLLDADGSLSFGMKGGRLSLSFELTMAESIDRDGKYAKYLSSKVGNLYTRKRNENWATVNEWKIGARSDLEKFLPHVIKHMVARGKKWDFMLRTFREYRGVEITREELLELREQANRLSGPVKPKNHPSWAWVAGIIDGDGWYMKRVRPKQIEMQVGVVTNMNETASLELLHKAFGGVLKDDRGHKRWIRNLGPRDKAFALHFLRKMVVHSRLKKWKIEQLLSTYSQRLSDSTPTGDAIV